MGACAVGRANHGRSKPRQGARGAVHIRGDEGSVASLTSQVGFLFPCPAIRLSLAH